MIEKDLACGHSAKYAIFGGDNGCLACSAERIARERDSLAAENAALRAELAFARSTGDESALEYHALKARLAEAERHLALVLPMAKGYASAHRVGANAEIVEDAAEFLRATDSASGEGEK